MDIHLLQKTLEEYRLKFFDDLLNIAENTKTNPGQNIRISVMECAEYEIVLVKWHGISRSPMHVHQSKTVDNISISCVYVINGKILQSIRKANSKEIYLSIAKEKDLITILEDEEHEITSLEDSITLNIYSPPAYNRQV